MQTETKQVPICNKCEKPIVDMKWEGEGKYWHKECSDNILSDVIENLKKWDETAWKFFCELDEGQEFEVCLPDFLRASSFVKVSQNEAKRVDSEEIKTFNLDVLVKI